MPVKSIVDMTDKEWTAYSKGEWDGEISQKEFDELEDISDENDLFDMYGAKEPPYGSGGKRVSYNNDRNGSTLYSQLCRHTPVWLFSLNDEKTHIYAGSEMNCKPFFDGFDLIVNLNSGVCQADVEWIPPKPPEARQVTCSVEGVVPDDLLYVAKFPPPSPPPPTLYLNWPDMGVPILNRAWWDKFYAFLCTTPQRKNEECSSFEVLIHCLGGHGRTGTMAAILADYAQEWTNVLKEDDSPYKNCIDFIRDVYCEEAVETRGQIEYIGKIVGNDKLKKQCSPPVKRVNKLNPGTVSGGSGSSAVIPYKPPSNLVVPKKEEK